MPAPAPTASSALRERYWLSGFLFLRSLGLIYFIAFLGLTQQAPPLIGSDGLLPARRYLDAVASARGDRLSAFLEEPTVFWVDSSDTSLSAMAYVGLTLSAVVTLGFANAPLLAILWVLYLSFVHVGLLFYGYGWEILLL